MYIRKTFLHYEEIEERLRKEKTVISENLAEDHLVRHLCSLRPEADHLSNHDVKLKILQKLMKELGGKIKSNQYLLVFDESRIRNGKNSYMIHTEDVLEVLLPIRKAPNIEIRSVSPGYFSLNGSVKDKYPKISNEYLESLWIEDEREFICSSEMVGKAFLNILQCGLDNLAHTLVGYMSLLDLSMNSSSNVIEGHFEFNREYLNLRMNERPKTSEDMNEDDDESEICSPQDVPVIQTRRFTIRESLRNVLDIHLHVRIIPSVTVSVKDKTYLIAQGPNHQADRSHRDHIMRHCWFQDCWWKEQTLLDKIKAADKGLRMSALSGIQRICSADPDLEFLTPMTLVHNLLLELDQNIDNPLSSWQRRSLYECFKDHLESLRRQLQTKKVVNYFNIDHNLLDRHLVDGGRVTRALVRINILLNSKSSLIRCINDTITRSPITYNS